MSTSVGALNATLSLTDWEFNNGLKQSETAAMQFAKTTEAASNRANAALGGVGGRGGSASKLPQSFTQLGYGIQDFSSQLETRGIGGAIGAVTNNVQMLGQAFGPVAGAYVAVGAAVGGIILPKVIDWLGQTKELTAQTKQLEAHYAAYSDKASTLAKLEVRGGSKTARKEAENDIKEVEILKAAAGQRATAALRKSMAADAEVTRSKRDDIGGWMPALGMGQIANASKLAKKEMELADAEYQKLMSRDEKARTVLRALGPDGNIAKADAEREAAEREKKNSEAAVKAADNLMKFKMDGLLKYGTEQEKLQTKLAQQEMDLQKKIGRGLTKDQRAEAFAALQAEGDVERHKLMMSEQQKKDAELGPAAKGSAGVDLASSAGVQAINRAVSGTRSEQDLAKQAQKTREAMLKVLEDNARQKAVAIQVSLSG